MHRNASPHSHGIPCEDPAWSHMGVNALTAVHSEQQCVTRTQKWRPACAVLLCGGNTGGLLSPWPRVIWSIGILQLHCRLRGLLSYDLHLTETSMMWHMTNGKKSNRVIRAGSNPQVRLFLQAWRLCKDRTALQDSFHSGISTQSCKGPAVVTDYKYMEIKETD